MKKTVALLVTLASMSHPLSAHEDAAKLNNSIRQKDLQLQQAGPFDPAKDSKPLRQHDFDNGTLFITEPGNYHLAEDIDFNPKKDAPNQPPFHLGWPSVLGIATDNVSLNLNGHTIQVSEAFLNKQHFGAVIELNNQPFPQGIGGFTDKFITPKNIEIFNGAIGRSRHHGIHGNNNTNVRMYNLVIRDWETSAISLNAPKSCEIRNTMISGVEHPVPITGLGALLNDLIKVLKQLKASGDNGTQVHINAIQNQIDQGVGSNPSGIPDTNMWGILLNEELSVSEFSEDDSHGSTDSILLENVTVSNLRTKVFQTVTMEDAQTGRILKDNPGFTLRWEDAFDAQGNFAPNTILKAQVYLTSKKAPSSLPILFADNILSVNASLQTFLSQVQPRFGHDTRGHLLKGVVGIRLEVGKGVTMRNCQMLSIENLGDPGQTLADIPQGNYYQQQGFQEQRAIGNDSYGISCSACSGCTFQNVSALNCKSSNGNVYGIMVRNNSHSNSFIDCESNNHVALGTGSSVVNPPSRVYGFLVTNGSDANSFSRCHSHSHLSPLYSCGFGVLDSHITMIQDSHSYNVKTSGTLSPFVNNKAVGFLSSASDSTVFQACHAYSMNCDADNSEQASQTQTNCLAAGFMLESVEDNNDTNAIICECTSRNNHGGAGKAVGILLDGSSSASITKNTVEKNHPNNVNGEGYGIQDTATNSTAMILQNFAFANITSNYDVQYTDQNASLPVITGTIADITNLQDDTTFYNISITQ